MANRFPHLFQRQPLRNKARYNPIAFGIHTANMAEQGRPGNHFLANDLITQ